MMNYRLTLNDGTEHFFGYAGELLQYAEREWPERTCKFAPVLLIPTGIDEWQFQGIDMRVLGRIERSDEPWLSRALAPLPAIEPVLEGEILGPNDSGPNERMVNWFVNSSLSSLLGREVRVKVTPRGKK